MKSNKKREKHKCYSCNYHYNRDVLGCCPVCHSPNLIFNDKSTSKKKKSSRIGFK